MKKNFSDRFTNGAICFAVSAEAFAGKINPVIIGETVAPVLKLCQNRQLSANTEISRITFLMFFLIRKAEAKNAEVIRSSLAGPIENRQDDERQIPVTIRTIWKELQKKNRSGIRCK
ncbi:low affinity iron permease family protein [Chryseobacterium hagamense]|uniref:low affinity iron permease family protein n=1 Tax=Chryseobacterium hagamense TaxID=395935 RepID=UPI0014790237|nr:low affinity iron permease family protein [Chryseobacterium hagamense]